jgi:hypothetical protein
MLRFRSLMAALNAVRSLGVSSLRPGRMFMGREAQVPKRDEFSRQGVAHPFPAVAPAGQIPNPLMAVMANTHNSNGNIDELTDAEIYDAIRDLDPEPAAQKQQDDSAAFVIYLSLFILLLGSIGFMWLYSG